jgi:hypothetical protein
MFCERCEGEYFVLMFDTYIGSVASTGSAKKWELWKCMECGLINRKVTEKMIEGKNETDRGTF